MRSLKEIQDRLNTGGVRSGKTVSASLLTTAAAAMTHERESIVTFLRAEAKNGTADWEYRLTKLAEAIERGEHEHA